MLVTRLEDAGLIVGIHDAAAFGLRLTDADREALADTRQHGTFLAAWFAVSTTTRWRPSAGSWPAKKVTPYLARSLPGRTHQRGGGRVTRSRLGPPQ